MNWTEEELKELEELYPTLSWKELTKHFKRTRGAITQKAFKMGLERKQQVMQYIYEQDGKTVQVAPLEEIAERLGVTRNALYLYMPGNRYEGRNGITIIKTGEKA